MYGVGMRNDVCAVRQGLQTETRGCPLKSSNRVCEVYPVWRSLKRRLEEVSYVFKEREYSENQPVTPVTDVNGDDKVKNSSAGGCDQTV